MSFNTKALIIIDHGSKVEEANKMLSLIAEKLKDRNNTGYGIIEYCHMELASPTLEDAFRECIRNGAKEIVVHPYFLVPGRHSKSDIPGMVNKLIGNYPGVKCTVSEPLGLHDKIIDVILERAQSC